MRNPAMTHPTKTLATVAPTTLSTELGELAEMGYVAASKADATRKAYARDAEAFAAWCSSKGLVAIPAEPSTVGLYLANLAEEGRKVSTIERALAGIGSAQRAKGYGWPKGHPAISGVMAGIRRKLGVRPAKKAPVMGDELARLVGTLGVDLAGLRDRALLTLGWFGAFRRSELVALDVASVRFTSDGLVVTIARSKTDQEGQGIEKGIPYAGQPAVCPVRALRAWLDAAGVVSGPLFRGVDRHGNVSAERMADKSVARIVQRAAKLAGIEANVAGHSLRAGFATTAAAKGKSLDAIMRQTGHRSERVARGYIRHATLFVDNAASGLA
jgi:integrase